MPLTLMAQQHDTSTSPVEADSAIFELATNNLAQQYLQRLPFRGEPPEYYGLFAGSAQQDYRGTDLLHVRGSRHDEIAYTFEGADARSFYTGENLLRFIPDALKNISLDAAPGATASNAAGLFSHRLRSATPDFRFSARGETDRFTSDYDQRFDTYSYGYYNFLGTAEGKIFKDNLHFFAAGEGESFADHYRKFWDGFRFGNVNGEPLRDPWTGQTLRELIGVDELVVQPGNIPNAKSDRFTINSAVTGDFAPVTLRAVGLFNWEKQQRNDTPILYLFNPGRIPEFTQNAGLLSLQVDYTGEKKWTAHGQVDWLWAENQIEDPALKDDVQGYRDSFQLGFAQNRFYYFAFPFSRPGEVLATYSKFEESGWSISGALGRKLGSHHLRAGFAWQQRTLRYFNINRQVELWYPRLDGAADAFGYNFDGDKVDNDSETSDGARRPSNYGIYLEDQIHARDLQLTLGLRYERFASDARFLAHPANPALNYFELPSLTGMQTAPSYSYLLPRISASFFANDRLALQLHFGKYAQQPALREVYSSRAYLFRSLLIGSANTDPRAITAEPVRTTQTALGLSYAIVPDLHFQATAFHKFIEGQLQIDRVKTVDGAGVADYLVLSNQGESTAKGIELALTYQKHGWLAWLNYTFSDVRGFTSYPSSNLVDFHNQPAELGEEPPESSPLEFNQQHRGNMLLAYRFDREAPNWIRQTGLSALFRFNSGHNFSLYHAGDAFG
jgi:hypothetical protein